jgi:hypothetical protein
VKFYIVRSKYISDILMSEAFFDMLHFGIWCSDIRYENMCKLTKVYFEEWCLLGYYDVWLL